MTARRSPLVPTLALLVLFAALAPSRARAQALPDLLVDQAALRQHLYGIREPAIGGLRWKDSGSEVKGRWNDPVLVSVSK